MSSGKKNMDNKWDEQFLVMQDFIDDKRQSSDDKMKIYDSKLENITAIIEKMMGQNQNLNNFLDIMESSKDHDTDSVVYTNNIYSPL